MKNRRIQLSALIVSAAVVWIVGCRTPAAGPTSGPLTASRSSHAGHDHGNHDQATSGAFAKELAGLSPGDRAVAEKQKVCPVTKQPLGAMGVPPKVVVDGREVFVCCKGCEKTLKDDPGKYLGKL